MHDRNNTSSPWFDSASVQGSPLTGQDLVQPHPAYPKKTNTCISKNHKKRIAN